MKITNKCSSIRIAYFCNQYCGPGTKLQKRLARGDPGLNPLDAARKDHIAYSKTQNVSERNQADKVLAKKAWQRVQFKDASIREKPAVSGVTEAI